MPIKAGVPAPEFEMLDETDQIVRLKDFKGKKIVLYFYPGDDTPGCTKEACAFRDDYSSYEKAGIVILGVSPDDARSHKKFKDKYDLPFTLLVDDGHRVCDMYGVWGLKSFMGRQSEGVFRTTFLINESGEIIKVFEKVKPTEHSREVLEAFGL